MTLAPVVPRSGVTMASLISTSQPPTSLLSSASSATTNTFGRKQRGGKVAPSTAPVSPPGAQPKVAPVSPPGAHLTVAPVSPGHLNINSVGLPEARLQHQLKTNILAGRGSREAGPVLEWPRGSIPRYIPYHTIIPYQSIPYRGSIPR